MARFLTEYTCFILRLDGDEKARINRASFCLRSGDVLEPGDMFTEIHSSGSAGHLPIKLTPPWVQRYHGRITLNCSDTEGLYDEYDGKEFLLFDAIDTERQSDGFYMDRKGDNHMGVKDGYYMAYLVHCGDRLLHLRSTSAATVVGCTGITRYEK